VPVTKPAPKGRRPAAKKPAAKKLATKKPLAKKPAAKKPAARKPAARKPAARKPAARPAAARPNPSPTPRPSPNPRPNPSPPGRPPLRPAPAAPPPPVRLPPPFPPGELLAERDVARLLRHGESFGPHRLDVLLHPEPVAIPSGRIALIDPAALERPLRLARQVAPGRYRIGTSTAIRPDGSRALAAVCLHVGCPPIARWVVAHLDGKRPPRQEADAALPLDGGRAVLTDGDTPGPGFELAAPSPPTAYWALDPAGFPVCLLVDLGAFRASEWKVPKRR
jgi:hypothetical protein